jgi:hypothetical protein
MYRDMLRWADRTVVYFLNHMRAQSRMASLAVQDTKGKECFYFHHNVDGITAMLDSCSTLSDLPIVCQTRGGRHR